MALCQTEAYLVSLHPQVGVVAKTRLAHQGEVTPIPVLSYVIIRPEVELIVSGM
jgi:hypothetical protein